MAWESISMEKITLEEAIQEVFIPYWKKYSPIFYDEAFLERCEKIKKELKSSNK